MRRNNRRRRDLRRTRNLEQRTALLAPDIHQPRIRELRQRYRLAGGLELRVRIDVDAGARGRAWIDLDGANALLPALVMGHPADSS